MSEQGDGEQPNDGGDSGYTPPATQQELNRIINERIQRERAKYADYNDLKGKAAEYDKLTQASKSAEQKAAEERAEFERQAAQARQEAARWKVAAKFGISEEDADLFLTGPDEDTLTKQAQRLAARDTDRKKQGNHVPREGEIPKTAGTDEREAVRQLFGG